MVSATNESLSIESQRNATISGNEGISAESSQIKIHARKDLTLASQVRNLSPPESDNDPIHQCTSRTEDPLTECSLLSNGIPMTCSDFRNLRYILRIFLDVLNQTPYAGVPFNFLQQFNNDCNIIATYLQHNCNNLS